MHSQSSYDCYCKTHEPTQRRKNEAQSARSRVKLLTSKTSGSKTDAIRSARKVPTTPATPVNDVQLDAEGSTTILPVSPVLSPETSAALEDVERLVKDAQIQINAIKMVGDRGCFQTPVNAYSNEISLDDENDQLLYVRERVACKFEEANGLNDERRIPEKPKRIVDFSAPKFKRFEERYKEHAWCDPFRVQDLEISTTDIKSKGRTDDPHEIPNNERNAKMNSFSVQTCPSVNIERHLTAQNLESIHISPDPSFVRENVNVGTYIVSHDRGTISQVRKEKFVKIFEEPKNAASNKLSSKTQSEKNGEGTNEIESSPEDFSHSSLSRRRSVGILKASAEERQNVRDVRSGDVAASLAHGKSQNREIQVEFKTSQQRTDNGTIEASSSSNSEQKQVRFNERVAESIEGPILKLDRKGSTPVESGEESILERESEMRQDLLSPCDKRKKEVCAEENREYKHMKTIDQRMANHHRKYCNQSELKLARCNEVVEENIDECPILKLDRKGSTSVESGDNSIFNKHGRIIDQRFAGLHRKYYNQGELKQSRCNEMVQENIDEDPILKLDAKKSTSVETDDESIMKRDIERKEVCAEERMASLDRKYCNQGEQTQALSNEVIADNIEKVRILKLDAKGSTCVESDDESIMKKEIELRQVLLSPRDKRRKKVHGEENREYKHGKIIGQLFASLHRKYCNQGGLKQARFNVEENIEDGPVLKRDARRSTFVESGDEGISKKEIEIRTDLLSPCDKRKKKVRDEENREYKHGKMIDQRFSSVHPRYCNRSEQSIESSSSLGSSRIDTSGEDFGHENNDDDELYYPSINELDDVLFAYEKTIADASRSVRAIDRYLSRPELAEFMRKDEISESDKSRNSTRPNREKSLKRNSSNHVRSKDSIRDRAVVKNKRINEAWQTRVKSDLKNQSVLPTNSYKTPLRVDSRTTSNVGAKLTESDSKRILKHVEETYANFFKVSRPRESVVFRTRDESSSITSSVNVSFSSMDAQDVDERRIETISRVADDDVAKVPIARSNVAIVRDVEKKRTETNVDFEETLRHAFDVDEMIPILVKNLLQHFQNGATGSPQNLELLITENASANNVESNIHEIETARLKTDNESEKECLGTEFQAAEIIKIDEKITEKNANGESTRENVNADLIDKPIGRSTNSKQAASSCLNQELSIAEPRKIHSTVESFGEPSSARSSSTSNRNGENNYVKSYEYLEQKGSNNGSLASSRDVSSTVDKKTAKTNENISNSSAENEVFSSKNRSSSKPNPAVENEKIGSRLDQAKSRDNIRRTSSSDSLRDCASLRSSSRSETKLLNTKESIGEIKDSDQFTEVNHVKQRMYQKENILSHLYEEMREQLLHSAQATNHSTLVQQDVRTSEDAPATVSTKIETVSSDTSRSEGELFVPSSGSCSLGEIKMLNTDEQDNIITVFVTKETLTLWSESSKSLVQSMGEI